jgi:concanavalin A-like lectin/glucanase superfamily protein
MDQQRSSHPHTTSRRDYQTAPQRRIFQEPLATPKFERPKPHSYHLQRLSSPAIVGIILAVLLIGGGSYALLFSSAPNPSSSPIDLQKGLVGWWQFKGNALDSTPHGNNCTSSGASLTTDRESAANSAYSFNGSSAKLTCTSSGLPNINGSQTMSAWIYIPTAAGYAVRDIATSEISGTSANQLRITASGDLQASQWGGSATVTGTHTVSTNAWHMATFTYNGTTAALYLDGQLDTSATATPQSGTPTSFYIGSYGSGEYWDGSLDDVRVYNRALSATEVAALYKEYDTGVNAATGEKGLLGWWTMNGNTNDSTPYANNPTVTGTAPTATTDREGATNSAESFNGSSYLTTSNINIANSAFTISFWAKVSSWNSVGYGNSAGFIGNTAGSNTTDQRLHFAIRNQKPYFGFYGDDLTGTTVINTGQWYFYTASVTSGKVKTIYVNGAQDSTGTGTGLLGTGFNQIGADAFDGDLNGSMQDVRLYNYTLSSSQVSTLYKSYNSEIALGGTGVSGGINLGQGLVGEWNLAGNAYDSTPYANNGTVNGATLTTDRHGNTNSAYSFNGSSNYIGLPTISIPSSISVTAWVYSTNFNQSGFVIGKEPVNSEWELFFESNLLKWRGGSTTSVNCTNVSNSNWHFVAATETGTTAIVYEDGTQCATGTVTAIANSSGTLDIGRYNGGYYFNGSIDKVRVYNRVLSAAEVAALYKEY